MAFVFGFKDKTRENQRRYPEIDPVRVEVADTLCLIPFELEGLVHDCGHIRKGYVPSYPRIG